MNPIWDTLTSRALDVQAVCACCGGTEIRRLNPLEAVCLDCEHVFKNGE